MSFLVLMESIPVKEMKINTFKQLYTGTNIGVEKSRFTYTGTIPLLPSWIPYVPSIVSLLDLDFTLKRVDKLSQQIDVKEPWNHPKAAEWDKITLEEYEKQTMWTSLGKAFVDVG